MTHELLRLSASLGNVKSGPAVSGMRFWLARLGGPILIVLTCFALYRGHHFEALMGDDLINLTDIASGRFSSSPAQALFGFAADKYRPVFQAIIGLEFWAFGYDTYKYILTNVALHAFSSVLLYLLVLRLAPGRSGLATSVGLLFAISRFAGYQLWQVTGLLEGIATFLLIAAALMYVTSLKANQQSLPWSVLVLWGVATFAHERYLCFLPAVIVIGMTWSGAVRHQARIAFLLTAIAIAVVNFGYKKLFGSGAFFVGTGGTALELDVVRAAEFTASAFANSFGFNFGPTYLSGLSMADSPWPFWIVAILTAVLSGAIVILGLLYRRESAGPSDRRRMIGGLLTLTCAFAMALAAASLTIRQEFRWVLTPYLLGLIGVAVALTAIRSRALSLSLAVALLALGVAQSLLYRRVEHNIFFLAEQYEAERLHAVLSKLPVFDGDTYLVVENPISQCNWVYAAGRFFKLYDRSTLGKVHCVVGLDGLPSSAASDKARILTSRTVAQITGDITPEAKGWLELNRPINKVITDLSKLFNTAQLNSQAEVDTPSRRGGFESKGWPTEGGPVKAVILTSGFNASIPLPHRPALGSELRFGYAMPFSSSFNARFWLAVKDNSGTVKRMWEQDVVPPPDGVTRLQLQVIPLGLYGPQLSHVILGVDTPTGDASGHWAVFANPSLVEPMSLPEVDEQGREQSPGSCVPTKFPPQGRELIWCAGSP